MPEADIQRYLDGIESQHSTKPKYMAHVEALLKKIDATTGIVKDMPLTFYVHSAVGAQLDVLGEIVGVDRRFPPGSIPGLPALLDDSTFRNVILARIVQNQWDGSYQRYKEIWDATVGGVLDATYRDNQDMTMDIHITGYTEPTMIEMILRGYIIPKPMGVGLNVALSDEVVIEKGEMVADADFYSNSARIGVKNHIDTDTETASETHTGAKATASSAKVAIANHIERDTEAQSPAFMGCCATSNLARITIPLHCSDEQSDMDAVIYGTNAYASSAHIVVATK